MKKIYISLITILGSASIAIAQPTLTSSNYTSSIGDSKLYYVADTNTVINTTTGANVNFDYSGLQGYGVTQTQYTLDPTTTTYASDFTNATLADSTEGYATNKNYIRLNGTDSITKEGIVADVPTYGTVVGKYNVNPEITMKFPFNYGDIYFDDYAGVFTINAIVPVNTDGNGNVTVNADGWGTLLLPQGVSITSVLRVKTTEYLVTDAIVLPFPFNTTIDPITISAENINYYKPSLSNFPIVSVVSGSYTQNGVVIDSSRAIISQYPLSLITNIDEIVNIDNISLYPNPSTNETTTLTFTLKENTPSTISIYNNLGQNVKSVFNGQLNQGVNKLNIETTDLTKGIYFVNLTIGDKTTIKKLIIE
jgi:hypothetical protein